MLCAATVALGALLPVGPAAAASPCAAPTIQGTSQAETLTGTDGPDVIAGGGGDDVILGLGGDDVLCGGAGSDRLDGGEGDDELYGGTDVSYAPDSDPPENGDALEGGPGDDLLAPGADPRHVKSQDTIAFEHAPGPLVIDLPAGTATGDGTDTIVGPVGRVLGGPFDDVITGTDLADWLYGGQGGDRLAGGGGNDVLYAGEYDDETEYTTDPADNVLLGGSGLDLLVGDDGDDLLRGSGGDDMLRAGGGIDRSYGGAGGDNIDDDVTPAAGQVLDGGAGRDWATFDTQLPDGRSPLRTTGGIDMAAGTVFASHRSMTWSFAMIGFEIYSGPLSKDAWTIFGTDGPDRISGLAVPVRIHARGGNDRIIGDEGDDLLDGGPGTDRASGYGGDDRYVSVEVIRDR